MGLYAIGFHHPAFSLTIFRRVQGLIENMFPLEKTVPPREEEVQKGEFAINRYLQANDPAEYPQDTSTNEDYDDKAVEQDVHEHSDPLDEAEKIPTSSLYSNIIKQTPAWDWLITNLRREMTLTRASPDVMEIIRAEIFGALPSPDRISRRTPSQTYRARFHLN